MSVSRSSTVSTSSQNGTMCSRRPPVAIASHSPSSARRRRRIVVDLACEAVDDAAADRVDRGLADQRARRRQVHARQLRRTRVQRLHRDLDARRDDPAEVLAVGADGVVGERGAEVHDDAGALDAVICRDGVDEPVRPDLARVVVAQRHPGLDPGADDQRARGPGSGAPSPPTRAPAAAPCWRRSSSSGRRGRRRAARGGCAAPRPISSAVELRTVAKRQCSIERVVVERPEVGLGVADVDGEQHFSIIPARTSGWSSGTKVALSAIGSTRASGNTAARRSANAILKNRSSAAHANTTGRSNDPASPRRQA